MSYLILIYTFTIAIILYKTTKARLTLHKPGSRGWLLKTKGGFVGFLQNQSNLSDET